MAAFRLVISSSKSAVDIGGVPMKEVSQRSVRFVGRLGLMVAACGSILSHEMPSLLDQSLSGRYIFLAG
jgi:hypothetical protein